MVESKQESAGYERAVALNIKITEYVNRVGLDKCSGSLPLVCLALNQVTVALRPWAIPQQPAGEILHRMVIGSINIAAVPYRSLTQKRCDEIFKTVRAKIEAINETTNIVTETLVGATAAEYAFLRRVLSVLTMQGLTLVPYSCLNPEREDDTGFETRCSAIAATRTDRNAKALGIGAKVHSLLDEVPTTFAL